MSAHLPIRISRPLYRQCAFKSPIAASARPFSTTIARPVRVKHKKALSDYKLTAGIVRQELSQKPSASMEYRKNLREASNLPDDFGLLPGTFIRAPFGKLMKELSWSKPKTLKTLLWYYWNYVGTKIKAWVLLWRFQKISKQCPPLHFMDRKSIRALAAEKYRYLYQCFASGNSKAISDICTSPVAEQFSRRIDSRPRGMTIQWTSDRSPQTYIMSNRAVAMVIPGLENTGIQQIVVRIKSKWQALDIKDQTTGPPGGTRNEGKDVVEYIVLQRMVFNGEFKDWKVWGFAEEWSPEMIEEDAERERLVNAYQTDAA